MRIKLPAIEAFFNRKLEQLKRTENLFVILAALLIGAVAGLGTILIRLMIKEISDLSFWGDGSILDNIKNVPWYWRIIVPTIGGLIVGPVIYFFSKESKRSGVPDVMQSVLIRGGYIRPRVAIVKAITTAITIGTGGSVGREGPIVQIGASIGSTVGQFFNVSAQRTKTFVGCGAAAGIAAAFNAPVAGALFAVEIILQDFAFAQFSPIVISSVMATVVSHSFEGNFTEFLIPEYQLVSYHEMWLYLALAFFVAIIGFIFVKSIYFTEDIFELKIKVPVYLKPAIGGALVGCVAVFFPDIMGVGYESINNALLGRTIGILALLLVLVKIVSTSITVGSGASGGVFAPSLFLGAMTGVYFGGIVQKIFPGMTGDPGAYALVAMGGLVSAVTHAPITAIIMIFELTNNYTIILPLMVTCIFSTAISTKLSRESVYTLSLLRRNIHISHGSEIDVMKSIFVKDVFTRSTNAIPEDLNFGEIVNRLLISKDPYLPVLNDRRELTGIISLTNIRELLFEKDVLSDVMIASDVAEQNLLTVFPHDNCQSVLEKLDQIVLQGIPVVDPENPKLFLGMIWRRDIYAMYNKEVKRRDLATSFASQISSTQADKTVHFMEGYSLAEIKVPQQFVGKSLKELQIRAQFGVDIVLIKETDKHQSSNVFMPHPDFLFQQNNTILILGEIGDINLLKAL